jgi:hypothetical protein
MTCNGCYRMSEIAIKVINTRKLYNGVYKRKCVKCKGYYIEKGDYKR